MRLILAIFLLAGGSFYGLSLHKETDEKVLQKNKVKYNDLFVEPIDLNDNNIPNGNSIYLLILNKLNNICSEKKWKERIFMLSKSFHSHINSNFTQMFSYIKILDICENNITVTISSKNPKIVDSCTFGIEDRMAGEIVAVAIVIKKGIK